MFQNFVGRPRLDDGDVAGLEQQRLAPDLHPEPAVGNGETLRLGRVDVCRRDEPVRLHGALDDYGFAVRVGGGLVKRDALPCDGVVNRVSRADHLAPSSASLVDALETRVCPLRFRRRRG
jgi:hypothetical protein